MFFKHKKITFVEKKVYYAKIISKIKINYFLNFILMTIEYFLNLSYFVFCYLYTNFLKLLIDV